MTTSDSPACGWPAKTWPGEPAICPCGFGFPAKVQALFPQWHQPPDELDFDTPADDDLDFG